MVMNEFPDNASEFLLNDSAAEICRRMAEQAHRLRIAVHDQENGPTVIDCGITVPGGLEAGRLLAEVCLAGLGRVELAAGRADLWPGLAVSVRTDAPVAACLAAQYAGWRIQKGSYFAMASGPMRAAAGKRRCSNGSECGSVRGRLWECWKHESCRRLKCWNRSPLIARWSRRT